MHIYSLPGKKQEKIIKTLLKNKDEDAKLLKEKG